MMRSFFRISFALVVLSAPLHAQTSAQGGGDALRQSSRLNISLGGALYQGSGEFFDMVQDQLTLAPRDLKAPTLGVELTVPRGERVRILAGADFARSSATSQSERATPGAAVQQTVLWTAGLGAGVQIRLRAGAVQAESGWDPYVSVYGGAQTYRLVQRGMFADYRDASDIFSHTYTSEATSAFGQVGAGAVRPVTDRAGISAEIRYRYALHPMRDDFAGFNPLNLSGVRLSIGVIYDLSAWGR